MHLLATKLTHLNQETKNIMRALLLLHLPLGCRNVVVQPEALFLTLSSAYGLRTFPSEHSGLVASPGTFTPMRASHFTLFLFVGYLLTSSLICQAQDSDDVCVQGGLSAKRTLQATQRQAQRVVMSASGQVSDVALGNVHIFAA